MRTLIVLAFLLALLLPGFSQTAVSTLPKDAHEILAAAAPFYDFSSPELKPWHLKARYQLYDLKGNPTDQGVWEYWWMSPKVHRSSWSRTGAEHMEWSTAEGALYRSGSSLRYFEREMEWTLLSPFPRHNVLAPDRMKLDLKMLPADKPELACVGTTLQWVVDGRRQEAGKATYYCLDPATLALRVVYDNQLTKEFSQLVKIQGRYLARQVVVTAGKQKLFTASVDTVEALNPTAAMFSPPADATLKQKSPSLHEDSQVVTTGSLVKKTQPVYPSLSKRAKEQGVVTVAAVIGTDGKIHDLEVLASPSPKLAESAVDAVSKWEYQPYSLNGELVEVDTLVDVTYKLGK
jgi:TonB family protein